MKIKVLKPFLDKTNLKRSFAVGEVIEVDEERGKNIVKRSLGEEVKEAVEETEAPKPKAKKRKTVKVKD